MKFTEEQAFEDLKAKMTSKGETLQVSDRTFKKQLANYYKRFATEEMELADFTKEYIEDFKTLDGNYRKDYADFTKDYAAKNQPKPKEETKPVENPKGDNEIDALKQQLADLTAKFTQQENEAKIKGIKSSFREKLKEKGIKSDEWANQYIENISIGTEMDIDSASETALKLYNINRADIPNNSTPQASSKGGSTGNKFADIREKREKSM